MRESGCFVLAVLPPAISAVDGQAKTPYIDALAKEGMLFVLLKRADVVTRAPLSPTDFIGKEKVSNHLRQGLQTSLLLKELDSA